MTPSLFIIAVACFTTMGGSAWVPSSLSTPPRNSLVRKSTVELVNVEEVVNTNDVDGYKERFWRPPATVRPDHPKAIVGTTTLAQFLRNAARAKPELEAMESVFASLQTACKTISHEVRKSALAGTIGVEGTQNSHGEEQKKLDVIANDVLKNALKSTGKVGTLASEEEDAPVLIDCRGNDVYSGEVLVDQTGDYCVVFDPLDGSSNIDAGISTGTIFGIFNNEEDLCLLDDDILEEGANYICLQNTLQPGRNLIAAGYCMYSSATTLMFTIGDGVHGFTLDESIGEFVLTHPNVRIPDRGSIYSFNEAHRWDWDEPLRDYITDIQQGRGDTKNRYSARYIGSMVADVHRTLLYGGVFGYPASRNDPDGKLRLLYEAAPMSFLVEQAGGLALTGKHRIMDCVPHSVHQRVPCIVGSRLDLEEMRRYYEACDDPELIARCAARMKAERKTSGAFCRKWEETN